MSGIFVGVDGSTHSQVALDWAIREAGIRQAPLTVITIHEVAASGWGGSLEFPADEVMRERDKKAVQEAVDKTAAQLGGAAPPQITVQALIGQPGPAAHRGDQGRRPARGGFPGHRGLRSAAAGLGQHPGG